jgi:hypothetical protein
MKAKENGVWKFVKKYKYKDTNNEWKEIATIKANFEQDGWHELVPPNAIILYDLPKGSLPKTAILCNGSNGTTLNIMFSLRRLAFMVSKMHIMQPSTSLKQSNLPETIHSNSNFRSMD